MAIDGIGGWDVRITDPGPTGEPAIPAPQPEHPLIQPGGPTQPGTQPAPQTPWDRLGDILAGFGGGGGGILSLPPAPQESLAVAPVTSKKMSPFAIALILGGLGLGGWYLYQRSKKKPATTTPAAA